MNLMIRPTGILIENERILLVKQEVTEKRHWSLPGGRLEPDETIEQCLIREMKEETGLEVRVKELLYLTDRFQRDNNIVHMSFLVERTGDSPTAFDWQHDDPKPSSSTKRVREIKMIPVNELTDYGFSSKFQELVEADFPGRGSYQGDFNEFYGEEA